MYFSKNSKLSKILSLILALAMVVTVFAACKKENPQPSEDDTLPQSGPNLEDDTNPTDTQPGNTDPTDTLPEINEKTGTVISRLNVRSTPSMDGTPLTTLEAGDRVEVHMQKEVGSYVWGYIKTPVEGWIVMDFVEMDIKNEDPSTDPSTPEDTKPQEGDSLNLKGVINGNGVNIRSEPSTQGDVKGQYNRGDVITILEMKNGWGRTNRGWVNMTYVTTTASGGDVGTGDGAGNNTGTGNGNTGNTGNGNTAVIFKGVTTATELNVRSAPSMDGTRVDTYKYGTRVNILEKDGDWGRTKDGWISLKYVYQDGTTGKNTAKGVVIGTTLNIRTGPGVGYDANGSYKYGTRVNILEQFTYNGVTWGCTKDGWISLDYVYVDGTGDDDKAGVVTGDELNIRTGPGTGYGTNGQLDSGDEVTILFEITIGDTTWGNIEKGWISMDYVDLD